MLGLIGLVVGWWWLGLKRFIPPPVGAFAEGPGARWYGGRGVVGWAHQTLPLQCRQNGITAEDHLSCADAAGARPITCRPAQQLSLKILKHADRDRLSLPDQLVGTFGRGDDARRPDSRKTVKIGLFYLFKSVSREGCTLLGSPGILG
jgi:hypothetical protein